MQMRSVCCMWLGLVGQWPLFLSSHLSFFAEESIGIQQKEDEKFDCIDACVRKRATVLDISITLHTNLKKS